MLKEGSVAPEFDGELDEVTIWEGLHPDTRIQMEYENQRDPAAFVQVGPLEVF